MSMLRIFCAEDLHRYVRNGAWEAAYAIDIVRGQDIEEVPPLPASARLVSICKSPIDRLPHMRGATQIRLLDLPNITDIGEVVPAGEVRTINLTALEEIVALPSARYIWVAGSPRVTAPPEAQNAQFVLFEKMERLRRLPELPEARSVMLFELPLIDEVPVAPLAQIMALRNLPNLSKRPIVPASCKLTRDTRPWPSTIPYMEHLDAAAR